MQGAQVAWRAPAMATVYFRTRRIVPVPVPSVSQ